MRTTLQVTTPPANEPTTVALVKQHCRIDNASDNELIAGYLTAARIMAEGYLSRALITQTLLWTVRPDSMLRPERSWLRGPLYLPRAPVQSIVSVTLTDDLGNATTIPAATLPIIPPTFSGYMVDLSLEPSRMVIGRDTSLLGGFPLRATRLEHIQVEFVAGYGELADVPMNIIQAIWMMAAASYEHRGDEGGGMPEAAYRLLDHDRLQFLGG